MAKRTTCLRCRVFRIRKSGNRTYFSIPLGATIGGDRTRLLDESIAKFSAQMGELNQKLIASGVDVSTLLTGPAAMEFNEKYKSTINALLGNDADHGVELELGKTVSSPTQLSSWRRYAITHRRLSATSARSSR
jgi:hypothetical protein